MAIENFRYYFNSISACQVHLNPTETILVWLRLRSELRVITLSHYIKKTKENIRILLTMNFRILEYTLEDIKMVKYKRLDPELSRMLT
jgi:hypothetical protein